MKKFALGILSVFILLGGVLLSACDKQVSLSLLTSKEITIVTNDDTAENFGKDTVEVKVENSSEGIGAEVLEGNDVVKLSKISDKGNGRYSFDIETLETQKSGKAKVRVFSNDDERHDEIIYVNVDTVLEDLHKLDDDNVDAKSNRFVIKSKQENPKLNSLNVQDYFEFFPITANVYDVVWTFEDGSTSILDGETPLAVIEGNDLWVSTSYNLQTIVLKATDIKKGANNVVEFDVIDNSTIHSFVIDGQEIYKDGVLNISDPISINLVRNNINLSNISGELVVNTQYDVTFVPSVTLNGEALTTAEWLEFFTIDIAKPDRDDVANQTTYSFVINAYDALVYNKYGDIKLDFNVEYKNYAYHIDTGADVTLKTYYQATGVEVMNAEGNSVKDGEINIFSNYVDADGYLLKTILMPDDVGLIDDGYQIVFNENPTHFSTFYYRGRELVFTQNGTEYRSERIVNGANVYVVATEKLDAYKSVVDFVPCSNPGIKCTVLMNFYKISKGKELNVTDVEGNETEFFISSSLSSSRHLDFSFKIAGVSTTAGISIDKNNDKFTFSDKLTVVETGEVDNEPFMIVEFGLDLEDYDFEEEVKFKFKHVSGKVSQEFVVKAFIPLQTVSISNSDKAASNAFNERIENQSYVISSEGAVEEDVNAESTSLAGIMIEAGSSLSLLTDTRNATLSNAGVEYKFLTYDMLKSVIKNKEGFADEEVEELETFVTDVFRGKSVDVAGESVGALDYIALTLNLYPNFLTLAELDALGETYFSISEDKLILNDEEFKGIVCVVYNGYDNDHEARTVLRFFALESFYKVTQLSANIETAKLFTTETLSETDIERASVYVTLTLRSDNKVPTYTNDLSLITFTSANNQASGNAYPFENGNADGTFNADQATVTSNGFYTISDIGFALSGRTFKFKITANSTKLQSQIRDILRIIYLDENGFRKETEIQLEIENVKRLESVEWTTRTIDNEIYFNAASVSGEEQEFTISTSFTPSDANDPSLYPLYMPLAGNTTDLDIQFASIGQTINLTLSTNKGGYGYLYLLPSDMVKTVSAGGLPHLLLYKYETDDNGDLTETPVLKPLSELTNYYEQLVDETKKSTEFDQYFLNNDGEKIYYKNLVLQIRVTIADGSSEEMAIRRYSQADLEEIDNGQKLYYEIMNDITLSGWETLSDFEFRGTLFGTHDDITLTFDSKQIGMTEQLSGQLFEKIATEGVVKDLTLAGKVAGTGFVADENKGKIENVDINVYYENGVYLPSMIESTGTAGVGAFVGHNVGSIINSNNYGASIKATSSYAGGVAGRNSGLISGVGVEFYDFVDAFGNVYKNTLDTSTSMVGGLVGSATASSRIEKSYVYAYSLLNEEKDISKIFVGSGTKAAFMAQVEQTGATVEESFAYLGTLGIDYTAAGGVVGLVKNSYITCQLQNGTNPDGSIKYDLKSIIYNQLGNKTELTENEIGNSPDWSTLITNLNKNVWEVENINDQINFGFMHLKNTQQSEAKEVESLSIQDVETPYTKVLSSGVKNVDGTDYESGILFAYDPVLTVSTPAEQSVLDSLNTIYLEDLFAISEAEAESLLLTSSNRDIAISKNSIKVLNANLNEFDIVVHSKMNFASEKVFKFVILNNLPKVTMLIDGQRLQNEQVILLQTGSVNARSVVFSLDNSVYLGGKEFYAAETNDYKMYVTLDGNNADTTNVAKSLNGQKLSLTGLLAHQSNQTTAVEAQLEIGGLEATYNSVIKQTVSNNFEVSVFDGATSLVLNDTDEVSLKPSEFASFEVFMQTDKVNDNIILELCYGEIEIQDENESDNFAKFVVDSNLTIEMSWTESVVAVGNAYSKTFNVLVKVSNDTKHLVDKAYELKLKINASSLKNNKKYEKILPINIKTQDIADLDVLVYNIESRQIKNSVLYLTASNTKTTALVPSSDAIVAVVVDPAYAMMSHFTLTYSLSGNSGVVGAVNISKLAYNSSYGYYVNATGTSLVENGIKVNLSESDKAGSGVYYFRIYVSGSFESSSDLKLILNFFNNDTVLKTSNYLLNIDYLAGATVKVNNSSNYIMSKGSVATVTVTIGLDQELYGLSLQNNYANISLSAISEAEYFDTYKRYTATLVAYVDAELVGGKTSGIFYVVASVARMINGEFEVKTNRASVYLVDFSIDGSKTKVNASGATEDYNGKTYDAMYAYINATDSLTFDYSIIPEEYIYNSADNQEVEMVKELQRKQNQFAKDAYYKDENSQYYINYVLNEKTGMYEAITLKQQLSYVTGADTYTKIHNGTYFVKNYSNDIFDISEDASSKTLRVTGKRTGKQLMRLQTTIVCQGVEFVYDYYFLIVVEVWSDEDTPTQISTAEEFVEYLTKSSKPDDYILMNDIVLENYTPVDTELVDSFDGNGYTIHVNSFAEPKDTTSLELALFNEVAENTTLKNVRVNIYGAGEIQVDIQKYQTVKIAGFAIMNYGIIYNCEVVSYFDDSYQTFKRSNNGIVVTYVDGANTDPVEINEKTGVSSDVAGFVDTNNGSIMNSRVGGESFKHIVVIDDVVYIETQETNIFEIVGQGNVAGFVVMNGTTMSSDEDGVLDIDAGYISACFVKNVQINNNMDATTSVTAGFVVHNFNDIQGSYVEGKGELNNAGLKDSVYNTLTNISAIGYIAGFVYENDGLVKNSYANIAIESSEFKASYVAGFVYKNNEKGEVRLCFAACEISTTDTNEMQFSGVDTLLESLNEGTIETSYYYNKSAVDTTNEKQLKAGPLAINDLTTQDTFYGFSFASSADSYDGIWSLENQVLSLVSANQIAISNRYAVTTGTITSIFYNKSVLDSDTLENVNLSYGSINNPIIIRNAEEFAKATGKATAKEISSYKEYYNNREVFGHYRLVNNIIMSEIDQNADETDNLIKLTTTGKKFSGLLDGNGFTIAEISLGSSDVVENYGLFAELDNAVVMSLNLIVDSIHNKQANIVGTLAGTAVNSRIMALNITPLKGSSETSIFGNNVVGGVVGMLFGESKIHDVEARNVTVYSSYNQDGKTIGYNNEFIGVSLRNLVKDDASLVKKVSKISYAGAIVGYADIYTDINSTGVKFETNPDVANFNIITVHVYNSVDIYAEVAGGLFGYIGPTTSVYDASIELNADMNLGNPSYIISKNLYAGGLVGENYGVLFGSYASYSKQLQKDIELQANGYYASGVGERGQSSIFSYASRTENADQNTNNPLFVGGLVGYMGSGYIYVAYSKLNVVSYCENTKAVGGIIGYADNTGSFTSIEIHDETIRTDIMLQDVYSSGDVCVSNAKNSKGVAAGIIGAMNNNNVVLMKNVQAVNYLSYEGSAFTADSGILTDNDADGQAETYTANNHFMLLGKVYAGNLDERNELANSFYILNSENDTYNAFNADDKFTGAGTNTVGGYFKVKVGGNSGVNLNVNPFGFAVKDSAVSQKLLEVKSIGEPSMADPAVANSQMYTYFLHVGWTAEYWEHETDELFPEIQLLPSTDVYYLDAVDKGDVNSIREAEEILKMMGENSNITVVVRGKCDPDNIQDETCMDVDLTLIENFETIDFSGRLISYKEYATNDDRIGIVDANKVDPRGGYANDNVGIILNKPMFRTINKTTIQGVKFYMDTTDDKDYISYTLATGDILESDLSNVDIVYNANVVVAEASPSIGLIAKTAKNTVFGDIEFKLKPGVESIKIQNATTSELENVYMGLVVGTLTEDAIYAQASIKSVNICKIDEVGDYLESYDENPIRVMFEGNSSEIEVGGKKEMVSNNHNLYAGLYAGLVEKDRNSTAKLALAMSPFTDIEFSVSYCGRANTYIGGCVGKTSGVDKAEVLRNDIEGEEKAIVSKLKIIHDKANHLYAGLMFGATEFGGKFNFINTSSEKTYTLQGGIYQSVKAEGNGDYVYAKTEHAHIGGLVGELATNAVVQNLSVDFNVGTTFMMDTAEIVDDEKISYAQLRKAELKKDYVDYNTIFEEYGIDTAYKVSGPATVSNQFGAYIGLANSEVAVTGAFTVAGLIDVKTEVDTAQPNLVISAGSIAAEAVGKFEMNATRITSTLDFIIENYQDEKNETGVTNVGGVIGWLIDAGQEETVANDALIAVNDYIRYTGNIVSNVHKLRAGGAVGYVGRNDCTVSEVSLSGVAFGGAVKVYGECIDGGKVSVGGVVGLYDNGSEAEIDETKKSETKFAISNCYSYGDVFVNYDSSKNEKLREYNFGGIIGSAYYVTVMQNYSLMTSFNNRLSGTNNAYNADGSLASNWAVDIYNVGAIVGRNSEICNYSVDDERYLNYYNSGVALAYQVENGNVDALYAPGVAEGETDDYVYYGYSGVVSGNDEHAEEISSTVALLHQDFFGKFDNGSQQGVKLNPYILGADYKYINDYDSTDGTSLDYLRRLPDDETELVGGTTHGITWFSIVKDFEVDKNVADTLSDVFIAGNGHTIARGDDEDTSETGTLGGFVNELGKNVDDGEITYSALSGLVLKLDVDKNLNNAASFYGGLVGEVAGNTYIYGLSVTGELSIGATDDIEVDVAGIAAKMSGGFINECSVTAHILYRANENGTLIGVAGMQNGNTTMKATYSIGKLETYVSAIDIYALAEGAQAEGTGLSHDVVNCYSAANIYRKDIEGTVISGADGAVEGKNYLLNKKFTENVLAFQTSENYFVEGMNIADDGTSSGAVKNTRVMSFGYWDGPADANAIVNVGKTTMIASVDVDADMSLSYNTDYLHGTDYNGFNGGSLTNWYFNPYVNFGFATHGFGYMKNVTTYTRYEKEDGIDNENVVEIVLDENLDPEDPSKLENLDGKTVVRKAKVNKESETDVFATMTDYAYQTIPYIFIFNKDILTNVDIYVEWHLGVYNSGKFEQMQSAAVIKGLKFVLTDDIVMNNLLKEDNEYKLLGLGLEEGFELDGDNRTVDFANIGVSGGVDEATMKTGIFGAVDGKIINTKFNNVKAKVSVSEKSSVGLLASTIAGLNNVTVEGVLEVTGSGAESCVGGIVGKVTSDENEITAVDALVNVTNSVNGSVIGGIAGKTEANMYFSTNNGIINDKSSGNGKNGTTFIVQGRSSASLNSVVGGLVGHSNADIYYSYNTNAVLSGYVTTSEGNYLAGGVVGYFAGNKIYNSYNTGLVGAGNYSNDKTHNNGTNVSVAGGIFGYASSEAIISACVNDGAVEAIGYTNPNPVRGTDYTVTVTREDKTKDGADNGAVQETEAQKEPKNLELKVKLTYNYGDARSVYAYGIGLAKESSSNVVDCVSSTENIKNDGNVGEISDTQYMTFDRKAMLANNNNEYKAKFGLLDSAGGEVSSADAAQVYVNGVDSYAFPARIYIKDQMTRGYYGGENETYKNVIEQIEIETSIKGANKKKNLDTYAVNYDVVLNGYAEEASDLIVDHQIQTNSRGSTSNTFAAFDYTMTNSTEYYSYVSFIEYDLILRGKSLGSSGIDGNIGLFARVAGDEQAGLEQVNEVTGTISNFKEPESEDDFDQDRITTTDGETLIHDEMKLVDCFKESFESSEEIIVNGKNVIKLYTGEQMFASYNPYYFKVEFTKDQLDTQNIPVDRLTKNNFSIVNVYSDASGTSSVLSKMQISVVKKEYIDDGSYKWCVYGYFADDEIVVQKVDIKIAYNASQSVLLGNNNVIIDGEYTKILLIDNNENLKNLVDRMKLSSTQVDGQKAEFSCVKIDGSEVSIDLDDIYQDETTGIPYIKVVSSTLPVEDLHKKSLTIEYIESKKLDPKIVTKVETDEKAIDYSIGTSGKVTLEFKNYKEAGKIMGSYVSASGSVATIMLNNLISSFVDYRTGGQIVVAPEDRTNVADNYGLAYNGSSWSSWGLSSEDHVNFSGGICTITFKNASNAEKFKYASVWYEKSSIKSTETISSLSTNAKYETSEIVFALSGVTVGDAVNGKFGKSGDYGQYNGTNFAGETSGVSDTSMLVFTDGTTTYATFYTKNVEYATNAVGSVAISTKGGISVGYRLELKNSSGVVSDYRQGVLKNTDAIELSSIPNGTTISMRYYKEATMYFEGTDVTTDERYTYFVEEYANRKTSSVLRTDDALTTYTIVKQTIENCEYCGGECESILTMKLYSKLINEGEEDETSEDYYYAFTKYDCGAFELIYFNYKEKKGNLRFTYTKSDGLRKYEWDGVSTWLITKQDTEDGAIIRRYEIEPDGKDLLGNQKVKVIKTIEEIYRLNGYEYELVSETKPNVQVSEIGEGEAMLSSGINWGSPNTIEFKGLSTLINANNGYDGHNKLDMIVSEINENELYFAYIDESIENKLEFNSRRNIWNPEASDSATINMYHSTNLTGNKYDLHTQTQAFDANSVLGSYSYELIKANDVLVAGTEDEKTASGEDLVQIIENRWGVYEYVYNYDTKKDFSIGNDKSEFSWVANEGDKAYSYSFLMHDVSTDPVGTNYMAMNGNGHIVKVEGKNSLFSENGNGSILQEVKVVESVALNKIEVTKGEDGNLLDVATTVVFNKGIMSNISYFGNVRNVSIGAIKEENSTETEVVKAQSVMDVVLFDIINESITNVTSSVSVTTLSNISIQDSSNNATDDYGNPVENLGEENFDSKNILIIADGKKGENGKKAEKNGNSVERNGKNGGIGGSVTVDDQMFDGVVRVGLGGLGGYGHDGENAIRNGSTLTDASGGGAPGFVGNNGTITGEVSVISNRNKKTDFDTMQSGGNGGCGHVGEMTNTGGWIVSSAGGGSGGFLVDNNGIDYSVIINETTNEIEKIIEKNGGDEKILSNAEAQKINDNFVIRISGSDAVSSSNIVSAGIVGGTDSKYNISSNIFGVGSVDPGIYGELNNVFHRVFSTNGKDEKWIDDGLETELNNRVLYVDGDQSKGMNRGLINNYGTINGAEGYQNGQSISDGKMYVSVQMLLVVSDKGIGPMVGGAAGGLMGGLGLGALGTALPVALGASAIPGAGWIVGGAILIGGILGAVFSDYDVNAYEASLVEYVVWTSGETLNSAGAAGYSYSYTI